MPHGLFLDLVIVYSIALAIMILAGRIGVPPVISLIMAGALAGPFGAGVVSTPEEVDQLAEIGVMLLLFTVGLDFPVSELRRIWRSVVLGGALQVAGTALIVAAAAAGLGLRPAASIFIGLFVALSSTAVVLKELGRSNRLDSPAGRLTTGVLLFQDICVVGLLLAAPILAGATALAAVPGVLGRALLAFVVIIGIGRLALPALFRLITSSGQREAFPIAVLVAAVGTAAIGALFGVSMALGAFLAGLLLAGSEFSHQAHAEVRPLRDLLTSLFFVSLGMLINMDLFAARLPMVIALAAVMIAGKAVIAGGSILAAGGAPRVALASACYLAQVGEFSFVLGREGLELGILSPEQWQLLLPASVLTILVSPALIAAAPRLTDRFAWKDARRDDAPGAAHAGHVIVLGYGVGGRLVTSALKQFGIPSHIIDLNGASVREARAAGETASYGDGTSPDTLAAAGVAHARAVVVVLSDPDAALKIVRTVRQAAPRVPVLVRARYLAEAARLQEAGAVAVAEELEASLEIVAQLLASLNVPGNLVQFLLDDYRRREAMPAGRSAPPPMSLAQLAPDLLQAPVATHQLQPDDWSVGRTLGDVNLRAVTGASVLAVRRDGQYATSLTSGFTLHAGDVLYLLGDDSDVLLARAHLSSGPQ